ncbi:MAG: hypothetical protein AB7E32_00455 [Desulfovibrio sp.]
MKESGLYDSLINSRKLLAFEEALSVCASENSTTVIAPEEIPFVSYPYEWTFGQLKDAALLTLDIHIECLKKNFLLKDASAYNIQFHNGAPVFIDHLSFESIDKHRAWPAYGQFCRHFLAPLVLMSKKEIRLKKLLTNFIDGIPLDLAAKLTPLSTVFSLGILLHLFMHAKHQSKYASRGDVIKKSRPISASHMLVIAQSLRKTISKLNWQGGATEWGKYYADTNYSPEAMESKKRIVADFVQRTAPSSLWDLGGNTGEMSRASAHDISIVCFDIDESAAEQNYIFCKQHGVTNILPLTMDFTNPSSSLGFGEHERDSLSSRGPADTILALALLHHLVISNNIPFSYVAQYFASISKHCIIEFIPKEDSQVQRLLLSREDIFDDYTQKGFEAAFSQHFEISDKCIVRETLRTIYLLKTRDQ